MSLSVQEKLKAGPMFDWEIMEHHFTSYFRDYDIFVDVGTRVAGSDEWQINRARYRFTHCTFAEVTTELPDALWTSSWTEAPQLVYQDYLDDGGAGYFWGAEGAVAFPGLEYIANSPVAQEWTERLQKPMHEVFIETTPQNIRLIFHDVDITWTSEGSSAK